MGSKKFTLNWGDLSKIGKNALLVGSAAALTYVAGNLDQIDLGSLGALFVPIVAVGLDTAIKWLKDNKDEGE
tara:strand:+ start:3056 stop:3271 length:216 start_codon:yes stop_codon:yes gene_type:complete